MKLNIKKITSVIASALMLGSTLGIAAAATYPAPFVESGVGSVGIVVGANAVTSDVTSATDLGVELGKLITSTGVPEGSWQVKTTSDKLEIGEAIASVEQYIGKDEFSILTDETVQTEKGTAAYSQYLYFPGETNVTFVQEDDDDEVGLFYFLSDSVVFAEYVMDFTTYLDSDVTGGTSIEDIEDKELNILGKPYTLVVGTNGTTGVELTLMSGANKATISSDEEITVGGRTVSAVVSSSTQVKLTVDGEETSKLNDGETYKLTDGTYIGISDITYESFAGGLHQSTFFLGADKILLKNNSDMEVNGEKIDEADVIILSEESGGDISITEINVSMKAEDPLYVPAKGRLSTAKDLDEPEVLITQNWDIAYNGLAEHESEEITLKPTSSDKKYILTFTNYDGYTADVPVAYFNDSGVWPGDSEGKKLILNAAGDGLNITKDDYFILNTANPATASNDARSYVLQYKGCDKATDTSPKCKVEVLGESTTREMSMSKTASLDGANATLFTLKLGGSSFTFTNATTAVDSDAELYLTSTQRGFIRTTTGSDNIQYTISLRTRYNQLINISWGNATCLYESVCYDSGANPPGKDYDGNITVMLWTDDTDRDDDDLSLGEEIFSVSLIHANGTEFAAELGSSDDAWISDPDNSDVSLFGTVYGANIKKTDPSDSPARLEVTSPESIANPLVYITTGTVSAASGGSGTSVVPVKDSESSSVSGKNLIVVGGSCINTVAAQILGSSTPLCEEDFTAETNAGAGQYIIQVVASPLAAADSGKIAMLVAGYHAADTINAVKKVKDSTDLSTDVGTSQVYPIASA